MFVVANTVSGRIVSKIGLEAQTQYSVQECSVLNTDLEICYCDDPEAGVFSHWWDSDSHCVHTKTEMALEYDQIAISIPFLDPYEYTSEISHPGIAFPDPDEVIAAGDTPVPFDASMYKNRDIMHVPAGGTVTIGNIPTDTDTFINIHQANNNILITDLTDHITITAIANDVINVGIDSPKYFFKAIDIVGVVI